MTSFNPQVRVATQPEFVGNGLYFETPEEALAYAADLQSRWTQTLRGEENRRAFETDEPVNYRWDILAHRLIPVEEVK